MYPRLPLSSRFCPSFLRAAALLFVRGAGYGANILGCLSSGLARHHTLGHVWTCVSQAPALSILTLASLGFPYGEIVPVAVEVKYPLFFSVCCPHHAHNNPDHATQAELLLGACVFFLLLCSIGCSGLWI